jgi:hypothetical protein
LHLLFIHLGLLQATYSCCSFWVLAVFSVKRLLLIWS